jgi:ATP-binding cassette subfamily B protein
MSKVFEYMKPYSWLVFIAALLLVVEAICALALPALMADIVNDGVLPGNIPLIWRTGGMMLVITLVSVIAALAVGYFSARTAAGVANDLRESVFKKILGFSNAEMDKFATSSLITRTTNDITQIQSTMVMGIRQVFYAPIIGIGGVINALDRSPSMTWIIALVVVLMTGFMLAMLVIAMPKYRIIQSLIDRLNMVSRESLSGILVVRAFSTQNFEKKRFEKANKDLAKTNLFVDQAFAFMTPTINLLFSLTTVAIVWIGAQQAAAFRVDIGDIFAFLQYGMLILSAFLMVAIMFVILPRAMVSANRIKEILDTENTIEYKESPTEFPKNSKGIVEFRNVDFRYPGVSESDGNVLQNISFTARPGETTAIIGSTGAGKTTIFNLLLRFYDVTSGEILIDGINIKDVAKQDLHEQIGYAAQKSLLFSGDIRSNLHYGDKNATQEILENAAEIAQAQEFISGKTEGYDFGIAQGGSNVSGGQRQRLAIARALVKNAPIYVFDDSFSALDVKTDARLRAALKERVSESTVLLVAQRISSIMDATQIIVLEHGKIVGLGTHKELLKTCEVYREIAASQLSEEEMN